MTNTKNLSEHDRCQAKRLKHNNLCQLPAGWGTNHPGIGTCKLHGGATANHITHAVKVQASLDVERFGGRLDVHPAEALLDLVQSKAAEVAYWEYRVKALDEDAQAGLLVTKVESDELKNVETREAKPHLFLQLLHKAQDQLAAYSAAALRAGADAKMVELATLQATWLIPYSQQLVELARIHAGLSASEVVRIALEAKGDMS